MGVQFSRFSAEHIFLLTFALPCITLNSYLDIAFKNFVPVHKDKNRKIFIFLRQLNELFTICPNYRGVYMEKSKLTADIFDGQEHYRFADIDLSDYNTAFPNSLISFMYMNVSSVGNMMDGFEQMVGRLFTEKDTEASCAAIPNAARALTVFVLPSGYSTLTTEGLLRSNSASRFLKSIVFLHLPDDLL